MSRLGKVVNVIQDGQFQVVTLKLASETTVELMTCDICKKPPKGFFDRWLEECYGCNRLICVDCALLIIGNPFYNFDDSGSALICESCYAKAKPFLEQTNILWDETETRVEDIITAWKNTCESHRETTKENT